MAHSSKEKILELLYTIGWEATSPKELAALYEILSDVLPDDFLNRAFWEDLLDSIDVGRASALGMVGLLRRLYPISEQLENWSTVVKAVEVELNSRDLDGEQILRGLNE